MHVCAKRRPAKALARGERVLATYTDGRHAIHELLAWKGMSGSTVVVDRGGPRPVAPRLIAHIAGDEPTENAMIVCREYLARLRAGADCGCRAFADDDLCRTPVADELVQAGSWVAPVTVPPHRSNSGAAFVLAAQRMRAALPQLRWWRLGGQATATHPGAPLCAERPLSLREAVGVLEDYEPLRSMTAAAIALVRSGAGLSTTMLRAELARVRHSPIVLNRALRETVLASVARDELSMSEIAIRCGRVKRDTRGNESGETSWLARRLGLLPEGGQAHPTPWVHSEVLGLIARRGLGIAPREVEL